MLLQLLLILLITIPHYTKHICSVTIWVRNQRVQWHYNWSLLTVRGSLVLRFLPSVLRIVRVCWPFILAWIQKLISFNGCHLCLEIRFHMVYLHFIVKFLMTLIFSNINELIDENGIHSSWRLNYISFDSLLSLYRCSFSLQGNWLLLRNVIISLWSSFVRWAILIISNMTSWLSIVWGWLNHNDVV